MVDASQVAGRSERAKLKIVHLTVQRQLTAGQRKQLRYEQKAAPKIDGADWDTIAAHCGSLEDEFEHKIPLFFRAPFLRSLYGWIIANRLSRSYDFVLMRHMTFDPFAFIGARFIPNRISVHHAKEIEEIPLISPGIVGRIAAWLESWTGRFAVRQTLGILGVTKELGEYESGLRAPGKPATHYPNGIDGSLIHAIPDERVDNEINAVFICGTFSAWHGLDRLIEEVRCAEELPTNFKIHLIGKVSPELQQSIEALGPRAATFTIHGYLKQADYDHVLRKADIGIGSLAIDRQNTRQGATLKTRELLANGIPLYSGHEDTSIPTDFAYYRHELPINLVSMIEFATEMKATERTVVRSSSLPLLERRAAMQQVVDWLHATFPVENGRLASSSR